MTLPLMALTYFFSAVPVLRISSQTTFAGAMLPYARSLYAPIWRIDSNLGAAAAVIDWEDRVMDRVLGSEGRFLETHDGQRQEFYYRRVKIERITHGEPSPFQRGRFQPHPELFPEK